MMIIKCYSIYDNKALIYNPPFFAATDQAAVRMLADTVNDRNTSLHRHPNDYSLFLLGHYDDQTGRFAEVFPLLHVVDAAALISKPAASNDLFNKE